MDVLQGTMPRATRRGMTAGGMGSQRVHGARQAASPPRAGEVDTRPLRIHLLGGFRVTVGDHTIAEEAWRRRKVAALVKLLALAPGCALHREHLLDTLWPDLEPESAANNLQQTLYLARRALDTALPGAGLTLLAPDFEAAPLGAGVTRMVLFTLGLIWFGHVHSPVEVATLLPDTLPRAVRADALPWASPAHTIRRAEVAAGTRLCANHWHHPG